MQAINLIIHNTAMEQHPNKGGGVGGRGGGGGGSNN